MQARGYEKNDRTIAEIFQKNAKKFPDKACIVFEDQVWTFTQVIIAATIANGAFTYLFLCNLERKVQLLLY